jgi:hypothetical protein
VTDQHDELFGRVFNPRFFGDIPTWGDAFGSIAAVRLEHGETIDEIGRDFVIAPDSAVVRRLRRDAVRDEKLRTLDTALTATIAIGLQLGENFSVAVSGKNDGPYASFDIDVDTVTVTLASNYDRVEPKESLFAAELSLLEWMGVTTDFFKRRLFLKSWPSETDLAAIAGAVALPLVYVFDSLRDTEAVILHSIHGSHLLDQAFREHRGVIGMPDLTHIKALARDHQDAYRALQLSNTTPEQETKLGLLNVATAYDVAAEHDDEVGLQALSALKDDLEFRQSYLDDEIAAVRELLEDGGELDLRERCDMLFRMAFENTISLAVSNESTVLVMDRARLRRGVDADTPENISPISPCLVGGFLLRFDQERGGYTISLRDAGEDFDFETFEPTGEVSVPLTTLEFAPRTPPIDVTTYLGGLALSRCRNDVGGDLTERYNTGMLFHVLSEGGYTALDQRWREGIQVLEGLLDS